MYSYAGCQQAAYMLHFKPPTSENQNRPFVVIRKNEANSLLTYYGTRVKWNAVLLLSSMTF